MNIVPYNPTYKGQLVEFFYRILSSHKDYISHGEMQMGVAISQTEIAPDAMHRWQEYLDRQSSRNDVMITLSIDDSNTILGFAIAGVESDGSHPFGMIYDLSVDKEQRGKGIGAALMNKVIEFLKERNIKQCYLESGLKNSSAHTFFERYGFKAVSYIFHSSI